MFKKSWKNGSNNLIAWFSPFSYYNLNIGKDVDSKIRRKKLIEFIEQNVFLGNVLSIHRGCLGRDTFWLQASSQQMNQTHLEKAFWTVKMFEGHTFKPACQKTYPNSHFFYQSQFLSLGSDSLHHLFIFTFPPVFYVSLLFTCFFSYNNLLYSVFIQNLFLSLTLRIPLLLL